MWWIILLFASVAIPAISDLLYQVNKYKNDRATDTEQEDKTT